MNTREQASWVLAALAAWGGYQLAHAVMDRLDVAFWREWWNSIPLPDRDAFRDALLAEEGITE